MALLAQKKQTKKAYGCFRGCLRVTNGHLETPNVYLVCKKYPKKIKCIFKNIDWYRMGKFILEHEGARFRVKGKVHYEKPYTPIEIYVDDILTLSL